MAYQWQQQQHSKWRYRAFGNLLHLSVSWGIRVLVPVQASSNQEPEEEASSGGDSDNSTVQALVRDADSVLSCLKRALKIANAAQQQLAVALKASDTGPAFLYVEILNQYLYYFEQGLSNITSSVIQVSLSVELSGDHSLLLHSILHSCRYCAPTTAFQPAILVAVDKDPVSTLWALLIVQWVGFRCQCVKRDYNALHLVLANNNDWDFF